MYVRIFIRVWNGKKDANKLLTKTSHVWYCNYCHSYELSPICCPDKNNKYEHTSITTRGCPTCNNNYKIYGPIWSGSLHKRIFVNKIKYYLIDTFSPFKEFITQRIRLENFIKLALHEIYLTTNTYNKIMNEKNNVTNNTSITSEVVEKIKELNKKELLKSCPLYYQISQMTKVIKNKQEIGKVKVASAIINAGYHFSY